MFLPEGPVVSLAATEKIHAALGQFGAENGIDVTGTRQFVHLIIRFWKILNVKTTNKGFRKRDDDCHPIRDVNDPRLFFLMRCINGCVAGMS